MLKRRIIPIELLDSGRLVKTKRFDVPRDVGDPVKSSQVYSDQDADELVLLNICRTKRNVEELIDAVTQISQECFVPLTVGGGISSLKDASKIIDKGADKVLVNSAVYKNSNLIKEIAEQYGRQAVVVGVDVRFQGGEYVLYSNCGRHQEMIPLEAHISRLVRGGAGEIMIQSIDRDGTMTGYDLELLNILTEISSIPVIIAGGPGDFIHLKEAFDGGADAAACGSLFNFGDNNPLRAKAFLKNYSIPLKRI
ncbi:imidazole glycerol phosphate synthase cyclase subunit [Verrucomicrobia bacterium]|nr:imidazole glycerol phosphate synthase cyclase subunit [Verrucomicrobiota bacterium]